MRPEYCSELKRTIDAALSAGADYAEARFCITDDEYIRARESRVEEARTSSRLTIGIRAWHKGKEGFAGGTCREGSEFESFGRRAAALAIAQANRHSVYSPPRVTRQARWATPGAKDPFNVPVSEKTDLVLHLNALSLKNGARYVDSFLWNIRERKLFASSAGALIDQTLYRSWWSATPVVFNTDGSDFETRTTVIPPMGQGWEYVDEARFSGEIQKATAGAGQKLKSPPVTPGKKTIILDPDNLWLTIHESCGHATELDRVLGFEADYAGTSFLSIDDAGHLRYGSPEITIIADRSQPGGLSTCAFDDEGNPAAQFPIVRDGILQNFQSSRDPASELAGTHSRGCAYAQTAEYPPICRMPNISLMPSRTPRSLKDLIGGVDDGIFICGDGSWSIDQQRKNFQFTGQEFWEIKNGSLGGMLRHVAYQGSTVEFWNSCDAVCDAREYRLAGSFFCGKGQPSQIAPVSHGSAPARFRDVTILRTR